MIILKPFKVDSYVVIDDDKPLDKLATAVSNVMNIYPVSKISHDSFQSFNQVRILHNDSIFEWNFKSYPDFQPNHSHGWFDYSYNKRDFFQINKSWIYSHLRHILLQNFCIPHRFSNRFREFTSIKSDHQISTSRWS